VRPSSHDVCACRGERTATTGIERRFASSECAAWLSNIATQDRRPKLTFDDTSTLAPAIPMRQCLLVGGAHLMEVQLICPG
jgi:hypothetical protein